MLDFIIKLFALIGVIFVLYLIIQVIYYFKHQKNKTIKYYNLKITEEPLEVTIEYINKVLVALISQVKTNYDKIDKIELHNRVYYKCQKKELEK